jgi:hypothetical protein
MVKKRWLSFVGGGVFLLYFVVVDPYISEGTKWLRAFGGRVTPGGL